jgi:hypothetical protein
VEPKNGGGEIIPWNDVRWGSYPFFRKSIRKLLMDEQWSLLSQNKDAGRVAQPAGESLSTRSPGKGAEEHQTGKLGRERRAQDAVFERKKATEQFNESVLRVSVTRM